MIMYPEAQIPVVCVSLHSSMSTEIHWKLGRALSSLRDEGVLILGSGKSEPCCMCLCSAAKLRTKTHPYAVTTGYAFHNLKHFYHPTKESLQYSEDFNNWLKQTLLIQEEDSTKTTNDDSKTTSPTRSLAQLKANILKWDQVPGVRTVHPREEHLLPLFVAAAAGCRDDDDQTTNNGDDTCDQDKGLPPQTTLIYDSSTMNQTTADKQPKAKLEQAASQRRLWNIPYPVTCLSDPAS